MKFIHIADAHLGASPDSDKKWGEGRTAEIEESFDNILKICEEQKIDLLLIAGDLYHEPPTESMLQDLDYKFSKLSNTKVVMIAGNHDYIAENSPAARYKFKSKAVILPREKTTNAYLKDLNVCVTGYSYGKPEYTERILENINPGKKGAVNILLGHGGDANHMPFSKSVIAKKGFDYVALGHIHKPAHILKNRMAFAGSLEPLDHTETGRRGYIYGEVTDGVTRIKWIPSNIRSYIKMELKVQPEFTNAQIQDVLDGQILKLGYNNIYKIILTGQIGEKVSIEFPKITNRYNIYEIENRTLCDYDENILLRENENNLLGRFIYEMKNRTETDEEIKEKALRYGIEALLTAGDK